jgi:cell division protein FtsL
MKRWYVLLIAVLLPLAAFLNVWQVFRYRELEKSIAALEDRQQELIEKNKRLIAGISVLQSPQRLEKLAVEELELEKLGPGRLIRIRTPEGEKEADKEAPDG